MGKGCARAPCHRVIRAERDAELPASPPLPRACAVYSAQNANQKEKFEAELKSQIKKLQRYRDDIKTWITNSDIKDKRPLTDARKQIETEMERFKVCEKEFKTKAFSKEGLSQAPKEDPKEKERNKVRKWIAGSLSKITEQVDVYEAEIELAANEKKKKSKGKESTKWEDLIERCRFHEEKLEVVLRLIDNDSLSPADVESVQDQLDKLDIELVGLLPVKKRVKEIAASTFINLAMTVIIERYTFYSIITFLFYLKSKENLYNKKLSVSLAMQTQIYNLLGNVTIHTGK